MSCHLVQGASISSRRLSQGGIWLSLQRLPVPLPCPCSVAFTVLAAAQTAAAMALRINFRSTLSEHDFYFWWVVERY